MDTSVNRRRLLATAVGFGGATGLVGCLQRDLSETALQTPASLDRCPRWRIRIDSLPAAARNEVETALEDGAYEAAPPLYLPNVLAPEETYLYTTDPLVYYRAAVDRSQTTAKLAITRTVPTHGRHSLSVHNDSDSDLTVDIGIHFVDAAVTYADVETPATVLEESLPLEAGRTRETTAFDRRYGDYELTVQTASHTDTVSYRERHLHSGAIGSVRVDAGEDQLTVTVEEPPQQDDIVCDRWWFGDMPP